MTTQYNLALHKNFPCIIAVIFYYAWLGFGGSDFPPVVHQCQSRIKTLNVYSYTAVMLTKVAFNQ